jgi:hypothetical protein
MNSGDAIASTSDGDCDFADAGYRPAAVVGIGRSCFSPRVSASEREAREYVLFAHIVRERDKG